MRPPPRRRLAGRCRAAAAGRVHRRRRPTTRRPPSPGTPPAGSSPCAAAPALDVERRRRRAGPPLGRRPGPGRDAAGRRAGRRVHRRAARRHGARGGGRLRRPLRGRGDRPDGPGAGPRVRGNRRFYSCQGSEDGEIDRSSAGRWTPTGARPPGSPTRCVGGMPVNERSAGTAGAGCVRPRRRAAGRHRRQRRAAPSRRTPAPWPARCCASTRRPGERHDLDPRAPQRAGPRRAPGHRPGVRRRARAGPRRRGEPAPRGRQLRLGPGRRRRATTRACR